MTPDDTRGAGEPKVVIAGTGRAGTTLLVQVLTALGADTGFTGEERAKLVARARAGFERNILAPDAPRIVKNPALSVRLGPLLDEGRLAVEHVIVPIRDLDVAAASRIRVSDYGDRRGVAGGMWGSRDARRQRAFLADASYQLVWTCARHDIPVTFLAFPRFARDAQYLYRQLTWLIPDRTVADVQAALDQLADPSLITEMPMSDAEWRQVRRRAPRYYLWTLPVSKARALWARATHT